MRLWAYSSHISKLNHRWQVKSQHTWARVAVHLKNVLDCFELNTSHLRGITTDNSCSHHSMTSKLQSIINASGIEWPALSKSAPCMVHVIQLALGALMSTLGVKGRTKSWEAHERDQQSGENERIVIRKSQRLREESNARINKVSAIRLGSARIIVNVRISKYFETPETDLHIAANACCSDYADTQSLK